MALKSQIIKQGKELLQQNTYFEFCCPECKCKIKIKTKDIFSGKDTYSFECKKCKKTIEFSDLQDFIYEVGKLLENTLKDIEKAFKKVKISIK